MSGEEDFPEDAVVVPVNGELDLHAFGPRDVVAVAEEYVHACRERGILRVRLVHGRGRGVQRAAVRRMLSNHPAVEGFADAPSAEGGWGATIVRLRPISHEDEKGML